MKERIQMAVRGKFAAALLVCVLVTLPVIGAQLPRPDKVVKPTVYLSLEPVPRGRTFEVAVVGEIMKGFHVNANKVLEEYLIPTTLTAQLPPGWNVVETKYPEGKPLKFEFSEKPLNVYDGTFVTRLKLTAPADAPLGAIKLPLTLRYQACNDVACLPPVKLALEADVMIAAAGARAVPVNQKIFSGK